MRTLKIALLLFVVSMLSITCKKEHIQPGTSGTPVFSFNGIVNGSPLSLSAGVNNYYMYSSYSQDTGGMYSFIGTLKQTSTPNTSIQFIINDYRKLPTGAAETNIATSLDTGSYLYFVTGGTPIQYSVNFNTVWGTTIPMGYTYSFGDGNTITSTSSAPPSPTNHVYAKPGNYITNLSIVFDSSGTHTASLSNQLELGTVKNDISASLSDSATGNVITYTVTITGGTQPYKVFWNYGDTVPDTITHKNIYSSSDTGKHTYSNNSTHTAFATVTDKNGITITTRANAVPQGGSTTYYMNYTIAAPVPVANTEGFSNVQIIYTDPSGVAYTSVDSTVAAGSSFQIISVSPYQNNENNQTTKMLHVKFNCTLYNGSKSISIKNGDAVIAVAYK